MKFKKRPIVIEAEQWFPGVTVDGVSPIRSMVDGEITSGKIETLEGDMVIEEAVENGETLPCVHKECLDPIEFRNAMRRNGTSVFKYSEVNLL